MANEQSQRAERNAPAPAANPLAGIVSRYQPEGAKDTYELDWGNAPAASVRYALEVALPRIIGGAASNVRAVLSARKVKAALGDYTFTKDADHSVREAAEKAWLAEHKAEIDVETVAEQATARAEAMAAILDGTIAEKARTNIADPLSPFVDAVLTNAVRAHAAKTGQAIPVGKEMTAAKKAVFELHGETKVRAKAQSLADAASF